MEKGPFSWHTHTEPINREVAAFILYKTVNKILIHFCDEVDGNDDDSSDDWDEWGVDRRAEDVISSLTV